MLFFENYPHPWYECMFKQPSKHPINKRMIESFFRNLVIFCNTLFTTSLKWSLLKLYSICEIRKFYWRCYRSWFTRDTTHHSSCYLPRKGHRISWVKRLTIVITLFLICFWCSILFLDRGPKHCHWDFALIVILKIASSVLTLAVRKTWRSLTWFGYICSVFNSLCILYSSCDKSRYLQCSIKLASLRQTPLCDN